MILRDLSLTHPLDNILFDEVLLKLADTGEAEETLRFWESPETFVVLGRICDVSKDVQSETTRRDGIQILRRASGGGTVVQGPGCLNYTLVLSKEKRPELQDLRRSYEYILSRMTQALERLGVQACYLPISDLALKSNLKKFSGNAQKRGKTHILHHGTLLYQFDLSLIEQYLRYPDQTPEYRAGRAHLDFVTNLDIAVEPLKQSIATIFAAQEGADTLSAQERDHLERLAEYVGDERRIGM